VREAKADVFLPEHLVVEQQKMEVTELADQAEITGGLKEMGLTEVGECLAHHQAEETQQEVLAV
jgi:hypothetical protein